MSERSGKFTCPLPNKRYCMTKDYNPESCGLSHGEIRPDVTDPEGHGWPQGGLRKEPHHTTNYALRNWILTTCRFCASSLHVDARLCHVGQLRHLQPHPAAAADEGRSHMLHTPVAAAVLLEAAAAAPDTTVPLLHASCLRNTGRH